MWEFDAATTRWRQIEAEGAPAARSYHVMASHAQHVYVFGGCAASGRYDYYLPPSPPNTPQTPITFQS